MMSVRPVHEAERLAAVRSYEILDTPADPRIDVFVRVAAQVYGVPFSMVSLVDEDRTWFKASVGLDVPEVERDQSFCSHAVATPQVVTVVEDARQDARFADNALVTGPSGLRFYAGAPITTPEGYALGTLCILDHKARTLNEAERQRLADLATGVGAVLHLHRNAIKLRLAATHDPLTGLANRALFHPAMEQAVAGASDDVPVGVICLDLDHFKKINDTFGHGGGDTVLRVVADRLRSCLRASDLAARLGGDEFAVLMHGPLDSGAPRVLAERILAALAQPVRIDGVDVAIGASAGYAVAPLDAQDAPALMRIADAALYAAKEAGRGTLSGPVEPGHAHAQTLLDDLWSAVTGQGLEVAWQPYFDLATRRVHGLEALVRWNRPGYGPVPPELFVTLAEAHGLAGRLDHWVLETACREAAGHGRPATEVSVNVTPATFYAEGFIGRVADCLASVSLPGGRLVVEVDERAANLDPDLARSRVEELAVLGVTVALHNFGSGDTALSCLREVPFGRIKLGRSFVHGIGISPRGDALIRSLVQMGVALGSSVCAEGIETAAQLDFMRDAGCALGQGYLLGAPTPSIRAVQAAV